MFTSIKGGLIAMIPSLMPIMLMFGLMGFLKIPLNPGTAMVAVIAVGIAIDGTIHLLARYQELCSVDKTSNIPSIKLFALANILKIDYDDTIKKYELCNIVKNAIL